MYLIARKKAHFEAISAGIQPEGRDNPFGFRADRLCQILVTPTPRITDPNGTILSVYKLESDLRQAMTIRNALIFHDDKQVVMLVSASTTAALERNLDILSKTAPAMSISVGASEIYQGGRLHSHSRGLASQAAEALLRRNRAGLLRYQEMGLELLLKRQARQDVRV
ncbi:hypothetical protein HJB56_22875 [Rhizobium lentis]|uniref:hypothetical protein n=1 Tax=Rhizobium lentis TaxID=1138194 RepID=UPI001C8295D8|nr:hypothetical protein [Rhizobium lentis]MBX4975234.1 hypothetical protein [Rhizobium lentis]MBX5085582.1 hypothetical protein [Rhizobium lentis]MBX5123055.1 hypothetical protein [Rhizobium lentis]MBX5125705.1 hypothetical protein [Rhizobium lentis]MBX5144127.1 hypothetical protein [Rhizobium lentis]